MLIGVGIHLPTPLPVFEILSIDSFLQSEFVLFFSSPDTSFSSLICIFQLEFYRGPSLCRHLRPSAIVIDFVVSSKSH